MARSLFHFIKDAERVGMPVKMLKLVQENYNISTTKGMSYTETNSNTLYLNTDVRGSLIAATVGEIAIDDRGRATLEYENAEMNELYHEVSHAYIDLKRGPRGAESWLGGLLNEYKTLEARTASKKVQSTWEHAEAHYEKGPMEKGHPTGKAMDPERAALEAIAMYVGHRAAHMWETLDRLTWRINLLERDSSTAKTALVKASKIAGDYNNAMTQRVFGYDEWGALKWKKQYRIERPISDRLKKFCDEDLLENKIPDTFYQSVTLNKLHMQLVLKVLRIQSAVPS